MEHKPLTKHILPSHRESQTRSSSIHNSQGCTTSDNIGYQRCYTPRGVRETTFHIYTPLNS